jgi:hypothetical protein
METNIRFKDKGLSLAQFWSSAEGSQRPANSRFFKF